MDYVPDVFTVKVLVALIILISIVAVSFGRLLRKRRKEIEELNQKIERSNQQREERTLLDQQHNIGNRILNRLIRVKKSEVAKDLPRELVIRSFPENSEGHVYTILVLWKDENSFTLGAPGIRGIPIFEVHVELRSGDKPIRVHYGPYGPDDSYSSDDLTISRLTDHLEAVLHDQIRLARS